MEVSPVQYILLLILLCLSSFFSAAETSLTSLSKIKLRNMVDNGFKNSDKLIKLIKHPKKLLTSILIGNNVVNVGASALATSISINIAGNNNIALTVATVSTTLFILIFGEIIPKTVASQNVEKTALFVVNFVSLCVKIFLPIYFVLNFITSFIIKIFGYNIEKDTPSITESELKTWVTVSEEEGVLEFHERKMINNVFDFGDTHAKDVMTPRTDIIAISYDSTYEEIKELFSKEQFSRIPIYKDTTDNIIGVLYLKDLAFGSCEKFDLNSYLRKPYFTYESKPTSELFKIMQSKRIPLAIVVDEYGGTSGLITLEDLVEEIVGDISDEYDDYEQEIQIVKDGEFIVDGATKIDDVNEKIGTKLQSEDFDSIGGYVVGLVGRIPMENETVEFENLKFVVEKLDKNRIEKLRIHI